MKRDKSKLSLSKLFSYLFISGQRDELKNVRIGYPLPQGRRSSSEQREKEEGYRHFLLSQVLRS